MIDAGATEAGATEAGATTDAAPRDPASLDRLYGRSRGKALRAGQAALIDTLLPRIAVPDAGQVTARALFGDDRPLHLEIGMGAGEHLAARADMLPDHGFIGCEPFVNSVAQALVLVRGAADRPPLPNVRIHMGDALHILRRVPDATLAFVYLLHPDPWPKTRHAKRRMMNDGPLDLIAAKLRPGGEFRFGTDHPVYLRHALMVMRRHRHRFDWLCEGAGDFLRRPSGWPPTRYEQKARRQDAPVWYFRFRRRADDGA